MLLHISEAKPRKDKAAQFSKDHLLASIDPDPNPSGTRGKGSDLVISMSWLPTRLIFKSKSLSLRVVLSLWFPYNQGSELKSTTPSL